MAEKTMNLLGFIAKTMTENNLDLNTMDDVVVLVNEMLQEKYLETTNGVKKNGAYAISSDDVAEMVINSPTLLKERAKRLADEEKKKEKAKTGIATQKETKSTKTEPKKQSPKPKSNGNVFRIDKDKYAKYKVKQNSLFE